MKFPLPRPLFPDLAWSRKDDEGAATLVGLFIDKLLEDEEEFVGTRGSRVDATKWKHLKQSENVVVYKSRKSSSATAAPEKETHTTDPASGGPSVPPFLIVGKVPGSLDDLLYGFTTPTREATLIKTSYVEDGVADVQVLRQIDRPSLDEPFSHLSIKWTALVPGSPIVHPRDYVYIDTIGVRTLKGGKRIGYRFTHSIDVPRADSLEGFIRGNMSLCGIFRESPNNSVHIYGRAFFEPGGGIPRGIFATVAAMQVTSAAAQMVNGQLKKLVLALRRTEARTWTVAVPPPALAGVVNACGVCMKKLTVLNASRSKCALCLRRLCHACRVRKLLSFITEDFGVRRLRVAFCGFCVQQAITLPSAFAATEEFLTGQEDFYRAPASLLCDAAAASPSAFRSFLSA